MGSRIKYLVFTISFALFTTFFFLVASIAIDTFIKPTSHVDLFSLTNSLMSFYCSVMIVTFLISLIFLFLTRKEVLNKSIFYFSFFVPITISVIFLVIFISSLLSTKSLDDVLIVKFLSVPLVFGPMILFMKLLMNRNKASSVYRILIFIFYALIATGLSFFVFSRIGPPWIGKDIQEDSDKVNEIINLRSSIQAYYSKNNQLPYDVNSLVDSKNFKYLQTFQYSLTGINSFRICTTFKTESRAFSLVSHKAGFDCSETKISNNISPTTSPSSYNFSNSLSCKTLNTHMITDPGGFGYIGCDMEVTSGQSNFDLSKSYCEGQITHEREYLVRDAYGRRDRYWTTLTNLNTKEEVKVYAYDYSGKKIECLPGLNK